MPMPVRCDARKREAGRRCCRTHSGVPRNSKSLLETCTGKLWSRKGSKNRERSSEIGSAALRPLHARSFLLRRRLPFIAPKRAVRYSIPHLPNPTASILACTYFVLICFLARVCVKSRFPRLGAPIPLVDGFLHDIRPHLTAHPPACAKLSWHGENRPAFTLRPSVLPRSRIGRRCCLGEPGLARRRVAS